MLYRLSRQLELDSYYANQEIMVPHHLITEEQLNFFALNNCQVRTRYIGNLLYYRILAPTQACDAMGYCILGFVVATIIWPLFFIAL